MSDNKLLHELLGKFDQFSKNVEKDLGEIKSRLEAWNQTIQSIQVRCAERGVVIKGHGERIRKLEGKNPSTKIQRVKDIGLWTTIAYILIQIIARLFKVQIPELPLNSDIKLR